MHHLTLYPLDSIRAFFYLLILKGYCVLITPIMIISVSNDE